jgi:hypothetical protein
MSYRFMTAAALAAGLASVAGVSQAQPQPGYFDIPAGFDFPANKQTLEQYRAAGDMSSQRKHMWNVFAGMTQTTPDGRYAIFETWYSEAEAFATGPTPQATGPRRVVRRFKAPQQSEGLPGQPAPQAAGTELLSEVMFNYPNFHQIVSKKLNSAAELVRLQQAGDADPHIPADRTVPAFPAEAVSLKTVWWPVAADKPTPMPVWDPADNPQIAAGNPFQTWKRVVAIDPTRTNVPPNEAMTIGFLQKQWPNSHVVGLDKFHAVKIDAQTAANAMNNGRLQDFVTSALGRPLQDGDYVVFLGTHLTTKEIDDWTWGTFWWHDRPDAGPYAADRVDAVKGKWRNYLMAVAFDLSLPHEPDGKPLIAFNPYLEAHFRGGLVSNCMNCHHRAAYPMDTFSFLPIFRGNPSPTDKAFAPGLLRTDFLWSVPFNAH